MHRKPIPLEPSGRRCPAVACIPGRVAEDYAKVEADQNEIEIQAEAGSPVQGNSLDEIVCGQLAWFRFCDLVCGNTAGVVAGIVQCPDIAGIQEEGSVDLPE